MTQTEQIIKYLKNHKRITVWTAMYDLRIARLSERIREIEKSGFQIHRQWLEKDGKRCVAYSLK
jgi:hypothetical protein